MPSTDRPSARKVRVRHSVSRSTVAPSRQPSTTRLRGRGHVPGVARDALFGEHRLQGSPPRQPFVVRQDQQIATHQPAQLNRGRRSAAIGDLVGAAQNVARTLRRCDQHRRREKPFGPEHDSGDGAAGIEQLLVPVDQRPHGPELVPIAQRILRRQGQFGDIGRYRRLKHGRQPFWKTNCVNAQP